MSVTNADPTHSLPPWEVCHHVWVPKQSQATSLGQHIYCTWINKCLSTVNFHPFITFRYRVSPDHVSRSHFNLLSKRLYKYPWQVPVVRRSICHIKLLQWFLLQWTSVVFDVAPVFSAIWKIIINEVNVYWTSLQCHWSATQPRVPQQSEMEWLFPPIFSFPSSYLAVFVSACLIRLYKIFWDVSFNSWGALHWVAFAQCPGFTLEV